MQKLTGLMILLVCFNLHVFAQQAVSGQVSTESGGLPLDAVTITQKDGKIATQSDKDGSFHINVPPDATLIFTSIGYINKEVMVRGKTFIEVQLQTNAQNLQDVVVIGYGTQKQANITGSIATISPSSYKSQPVVDVSSALQGRATGVSVNSISGAPGGIVKVRIRGANSINSSNDPLFVIDGIALGSINFQDVNVNDIESMEVLKDASATAIYGSRGANGVVIITTKSGKVGKMAVNVNSFVSFNNVKKYDLLGPVQYAEQANHIAGVDVLPNPQSYSGKGTKWQDQLFQTGITQNYEVSLSGGTDKSRYYVSGYYVDQTGIVINTSQKKIAIRSNMDSKLGKTVSFGLNLFMTNIQTKNNGDLGSKTSPVTSSLTWAPTEPVYDDPAAGAYNRYAISPLGANPYMLAKENKYEGSSNSAVVNAKLKWDITDWLSFNTNFAVDAVYNRSGYVNNDWVSQGNMQSGQGSSTNYTLQNSNVLTYHKAFNGGHNLSVAAVYEQTTNTYSGFNASGSQLATTNYGYYALGLNGSQGISSFYSNWGLQSYLGRITYSYKEKYLLMATYRADGSSKFQTTSNKWAYFPSLSAGWKISEENFLKNATAISNLKLRGSWGKTGNQGINPYSTLGLLDGQQYSYGTETGYPGFTLGNPANPDLKWETTNQWDIGLDAGFFGGRLNVTMDYFHKLTDGLLLQKTIPDYNGGGSKWVNLGSVLNSGFEFSVNALAVNHNKFSWNVTLNVSTLKNTVQNVGDQSIIYVVPWIGAGFINTSIQAIKPGSPLGAFYLIPWEGVYQSADAALGFQPGDNKYKDVSGNNSIGYEDRVVVGNPIPKWQYGFSNDFTYGNFSLNIFIQGVQGNNIFNATYAAVAAPSSDIKYPTLAASANYWTKSNAGSEWADPASKTGRTYVESTHYLQDGSYMRLKNISLSYLLSRKMIGFGDITISVSGQNLVTITKYKGFDPEADSQGNTDIAAGVDLGAYPNPHAFTIGLRANF